MYDVVSPVWGKILSISRIEALVRDLLYKVETVESKDTVKILDIGSGTGIASFILAEKIPNSKIFSIDTNYEMLDIVRKKAVKKSIYNNIINTYYGDINNIKTIKDLNGNLITLNNNYFDLIITNAVLEYADIKKVIPDLKKLLKSDGKIIVSVMKNNLIGKLCCIIFKCLPIDYNSFLSELKNNKLEIIYKSKFNIKYLTANMVRRGLIIKNEKNI